MGGDPRRAPEKQTVGTVTTSHKMLTLQALSSSLNAGALQREAALAEERLLGDLRQSVPQNGLVHQHTIDLNVLFERREAATYLSKFSYFGPEVRNLFSSRPTGPQPGIACHCNSPSIHGQPASIT